MEMPSQEQSYQEKYPDGSIVCLMQNRQITYYRIKFYNPHQDEFTLIRSYDDIEEVNESNIKLELFSGEELDELSINRNSSNQKYPVGCLVNMGMDEGIIVEYVKVKRKLRDGEVSYSSSKGELPCSGKRNLDIWVYVINVRGQISFLSEEKLNKTNYKPNEPRTTIPAKPILKSPTLS